MKGGLPDQHDEQQAEVCQRPQSMSLQVRHHGLRWARLEWMAPRHGTGDTKEEVGHLGGGPEGHVRVLLHADAALEGQEVDRRAYNEMCRV